MENLIILIIVVGAIYKIYKGYIEEQEKAKKRLEQIKRELQNKNPHQAPVPQVPIPQPVKTSSKPPLVTQKRRNHLMIIQNLMKLKLLGSGKLNKKGLKLKDVSNKKDNELQRNRFK